MYKESPIDAGFILRLPWRVPELSFGASATLRISYFMRLLTNSEAKFTFTYDNDFNGSGLFYYSRLHLTRENECRNAVDGRIRTRDRKKIEQQI
ncbi:hypothetical protein ANCCAN_21771 [Ancylostoma caninum]|uniref:Uncharacterized protein n=1 Tax=Ancylostoma caninum TaxID=29170 RepID=A0A368FQD8_ANCCA|nr:hypothetical protein ANCCAN_21771 [Ancylostoma caninum]